MKEKAPKKVYEKKLKIYAVEFKDEVRLIRTFNKSKAIAFVFGNLNVEIPSPDRLVELIQSNIQVEDIPSSEGTI